MDIADGKRNTTNEHVSHPLCSIGAPRGLERRTFGAKARSSNRSTLGAVINLWFRPGVGVISHLPYIMGAPLYMIKLILCGGSIIFHSDPAWGAFRPFGPFFFGVFVGWRAPLPMGGSLFINSLVFFFSGSF